ncbi:regulator of chromosome condensation (RCC1) [Reticulomyxa filosa]|uniref:Regulator of chromosome condensation (RCC1) n=1 Tax=Reticulomyxa filosa TaxID=46433 RepID=X6MSA9_RETFI|nr:regulator of chromosome condensation (RCC1) [Reticulomyxa filosa]|eukprot:ETO16729.1 regulator of chromosome condensation (RCC1) [Reticulomyxa filosa]
MQLGNESQIYLILWYWINELDNSSNDGKPLANRVPNDLLQLIFTFSKSHSVYFTGIAHCLSLLSTATSQDDPVSEKPCLISQLSGNSNCQIVDAACGHDFAVCRSSDDRLFTFGDNVNGQLGNGAEVRQNAIFESTYFADRKIHISQISCGHLFTLIVDTNNNFYAYGWNFSHQCDPTDTHAVRNIVQAPHKVYSHKYPIASIHCGQYHCVSIDVLGNIMSWGSDEGFESSLIPSLASGDTRTNSVLVIENSSIQKIFAQYQHKTTNKRNFSNIFSQYQHKTIDKYNSSKQIVRVALGIHCTFFLVQNISLT